LLAIGQEKAAGSFNPEELGCIPVHLALIGYFVYFLLLPVVDALLHFDLLVHIFLANCDVVLKVKDPVLV
jgi:hypothetical protein